MPVGMSQNDTGCSMTDDYDDVTYRSYARGEYRGMLNYEAILSAHIQKLMQYRDSNPTLYCSSIETLIIHCPKQIRMKAFKRLTSLGLVRGHYQKVNEEKQLVYDDLLIYVNELLEEANLIFRTGTFEKGHD